MPKINKKAVSFSDEERAAAQEYVRELRSGKKAQTEEALMAKIVEMPENDRFMAQKIHEIVKKVAPELLPRTWYGMPAWSNKDGKVVCFFQTGAKFKYRYSTLGFQDAAKLDQGHMWPTSYAITKLTEKEEKEITELIKKAVD